MSRRTPMGPVCLALITTMAALVNLPGAAADGAHLGDCARGTGASPQYVVTCEDVSVEWREQNARWHHNASRADDQVAFDVQLEASLHIAFVSVSIDVGVSAGH